MKGKNDNNKKGKKYILRKKLTIFRISNSDLQYEIISKKSIKR